MRLAIKHFLIFMLSLPQFLPATFAQTVTKTSDCECVNLFDELVEKIEENHIAYHIEIKGKRDAEYRDRINIYRKKAEQTSADKCVPVLKEFIEFYKDGHLYIGQSPKLSDAEKKRLTASAEKIERSETDIRSYLDKNAKKLDSIEGIWYSKDKERFAVFRDTKSKNRDFVAVSLSENSGNWEKGQVKAEFKKLNAGSYEVIYYDENHYRLYPGTYHRGKKGGADIRRNLILHMPPISWGREYPTNKDALNFIDSEDPRRPTMKIIDSSTVLFSIPSHVPDYAPLLKEFVEKNQEQIGRADNLIIDLRGNEGGSSWMTNVLMPYIETVSKHAGKYWVDDEEFVLSSPRNIRYFKAVESQGWLPKNLIKRMEENPGRLVLFNDPKDESAVSNSEEKAEEVKETPKPQNVAILMDDSIVSAGEAFIIKAMKNKKVTLFGENTAGVIDYRSTYWIPLSHCSTAGIYLGYPMFAASNRLPEGGVNKTGIAPDVRIGENESDPIRFIIDYYKRKSGQ